MSINKKERFSKLKKSLKNYGIKLPDRFIVTNALTKEMIAGPDFEEDLEIGRLGIRNHDILRFTYSKKVKGILEKKQIEILCEVKDSVV